MKAGGSGKGQTMFVALESMMLDYYVEQNGLPFKATNWLGEVIGFIFAQVGGYDTDDLERVESIEEMRWIVESAKKIA